MTWLAVKHFLQRAWVWTKNHWYIPLIAVLALAAVRDLGDDIIAFLWRAVHEDGGAGISYLVFPF